MTKQHEKNTKQVCLIDATKPIEYRDALPEMTQTIKSTGIVIIVGNYGSGKTEVAVNLAVRRKNDGLDVSVADLDLVNPYFRTREARRQLAKAGVEVVLPPEQYLQADLPIVSPLISGLIRRPKQLAIIDVGGDDAGATVLSSLADAFGGMPYEMLQVINPFRPFTGSASGCLKIRAEIESAARMNVTGFISNANLIDETTVKDILNGHTFVSRLSEETGLPLAFITAETRLLPELATQPISCPILPIERQLVPPWVKARAFSLSEAQPSG